MEAVVRVRLVFPSHRHILSKTQKEEELLNRSWFLLNPTIHPTIAHLSSHLTRLFNLTHSSPHGISLSMDGYVLPPFESTCILKDNDLIRVKKKKGGNDGVNLIEGEDVAEKKPKGNNVLLLGNGELDDESDGNEIKLEEGEVNVTEDLLPVDRSAGQSAGSKKRKTRKKHRNGKDTRKAKTSTQTPEVADGAEATGKRVVTEKQHVDIRFLRVENDEFEKEINIYQSEVQEKEAVPKKRKASKELDSPYHRKKKKRAVIHQDSEMDLHAEQHEPWHSPKSLVVKNKESSVTQHDIECDLYLELNECTGMSSGMNVDNTEKVSELESEHGEESAAESGEINGEFVEPLPIPNRVSLVHENGTESVGVPHTSEGTTKKISRSTRRIYEKRKFRKELKAEVKELLAEKVLIPHNHSPKTDRATDEYYPNGVVRPGHIRFEPYGKDQDVQQSRIVVETSQLIGTTSKRKNRKLGEKKIREYCTRSKCKDFGGEFSPVAMIGKANSQDNLTEFNGLPLLTSCPKEGDVIAYRVMEQLADTGPILSSFRVGKTLRLDTWAKTLLLTPVEENPVTYAKPNKGACEQHQDNSINKESGHIEIDVASLYDVRIIKHAPGNEVDIWDSLSQASSVKNSLLTRKKDWGKVGPSPTLSKQAWGQASTTATSSNNVWSKVGPTTTSSNNGWEVGPNTISSKSGWGKVGQTTTSSKQGWGKAGPTTASSNNEWDKVGPTTSSDNDWGKVGPTETPSKKEWGKVCSTTTIWKKDWGKAGSNTTSYKQEWRKAGPNTTSSKKEWSSAGPDMTLSKKEWSNAGPTTSSWSSKFLNDTKQS